MTYRSDPESAPTDALTLDLDPDVLRLPLERPTTTLGDRIRWAREQQGLSMRELGLASGLSKESIYRMEKGVIDVRSSHLVHLARALGVGVEWLLLG